MLTIKIKTAGSAFEPTPEHELARLVQKCANYLQAKAEFEDNGNYEVPLMDINGNRCGTLKVTGRNKK